MPTYEYACKSCGEHVEVVQSFKDDPLTECPACGGPLRKVFGNIGIAFKGSGFYKTDSRKAGVGSAPVGFELEVRRRLELQLGFRVGARLVGFGFGLVGDGVVGGAGKTSETTGASKPAAASTSGSSAAAS